MVAACYEEASQGLSLAELKSLVISLPAVSRTAMQVLLLQGAGHWLCLCACACVCLFLWGTGREGGVLNNNQHLISSIT